MSLDWQSAAQGSRVIPCVLIAGLPVVLVPEGVTLTGWTAGALDDAWWPGSSFGGWSSYVKAWLSLEHGISWDEKVEPVQPEMLNVSALTIRVSDIGLRADGTHGLATALFASRDSVNGTWITADCTATDTTVSVADTTGFASSGYLYLGRETMAYTSKTSTSFAVGSAANRGKFGSPVQHHWYVGNGNAAIANPEVTAAAPEIIGRTATVWLLRVSAAGVVTSGELAFYGAIGSGIALDDASEQWTLRVDHAVKRLSTPLRGETISVGGYVHGAPDSARGLAGGINPLMRTRTWAPTCDVWSDATGDLVAINVLTSAAAAPDNGGYHLTAAGYVQALNLAVASLFSAPDVVVYSLVGDRLRLAAAYSSGSYSLNLAWVWDRPGEAGQPGPYGGAHDWTSQKPFPSAWVPILAGSGSRVYVSAADYANVPAVPTAVTGSAYYVLAFGSDEEPRYAKITGRSSSGGLYWLTVEAITADRAQFDTLGVNGFGFVITQTSTARIVCYVTAPTWVDALESVITTFDTTLAENNAAAFDFDDMRDVIAQYPAGPYTRDREYVVDLSTSLLDLITNECRLNGFSLVLRRGRISITRVSDFAPTEPSAGTIATADLAVDSPRPTYARGFDGIINAMRFESPQTGVTVNVVDATSLTRYGPGRATIVATAPRQISGTVVNPAGAYLELARQAATVLGPLRYPYEYVTLTTTIAHGGLQVGDVVALDLWRVPDQQGARGIAKSAQIISRGWTLYDGGRAALVFTARLSPVNLAGWAPSVLVAAGGITGATVTADTSTFGASGFAPSGTNGGAEFFALGDAVRLVEIGTTSPTASTQHTVGGVSGAVLTLSPSPSGTFAGLAASALKVMVVPDEWTSATTDQRLYAYLADTSYRLDASTRARVLAA